jgi:feruloyl esterase
MEHKCTQQFAEKAFKHDRGAITVLLVHAYKAGDALPPGRSDSPTALADLCQVKVLVGPGNPGPEGAPSTSAGIGIEVWLPDPKAWNQRVHAIGNGGWAGTAETSLTAISGAGANDRRSAPNIAATEGAVTSTSDDGHVGSSGAFAMLPDGTVNQTLWTDFASRGIHEQVVQTKALATHFYKADIKRTYWDGGSTGGRQALKQAQLYPQDFDGIIVGYPAINWTKFITSELNPQIVFQQDLGGVNLTSGQLSLMSNAAINACDLVNGQHLGLPLDPSTCQYDPTKDPAVLCVASGGTNTTSSCVSAVQAQAMNKVWYGQTIDGSVPDPAIDNGWAVNPIGVQRWYGLTRGANVTGLAGTNPFSIATDQVALELQNPTIATPAFINATGNGQNLWKLLTYPELSNAADRGLALQPVFDDINTDNPDLSAFKAHGGKLIEYHGLSDTLIMPQGSINYYERVITQFGALPAVQSFYRMYLIPGMAHGPGNGTANPNANPPFPAPGQIYSMLTDWVEKGITPADGTVMNSASATPVAKSLPMCAYPKKQSYVSGDIFAAASYTCK